MITYSRKKGDINILTLPKQAAAVTGHKVNSVGRMKKKMFEGYAL